MRVLNPFSIALNKWDGRNRNPVMKVEDKPLAEYRGVTVHQYYSGHFCFVRNGVVLSERCGWKETFSGVIDALLDEPSERLTENLDGARPFHYLVK